jgi:PST family polysaccharide transporter
VLNFSAFEMPRLRFSMNSIRPHMASGGLLIGTRLSEYIGRVGENVLIDRLFGTAQLGSFTFANQIPRFATETVGNVSWAALYVQALTADKASVVEIHRRLCRMLAGILFPTTLLAAAAAPELIDMLLGPKWTQVALMLRILLPISALSIIAVQVGPILLAIDRFGIYFWCAVGLSAARVVAVCAGLWVGLTGVVFGIAGVTLLHFAILIVLSAPSTGCRVSPMLRGLAGPAISSLVAASGCLLLLRLLSPSTGATLVSLALGLAVFTACMFLIDRKGLTEDWDVIRGIAMGRGTK